jgi:hypothetical protein
VPYNLDGFPGYRIELLAANTVVASDQSSAGAIPEGEWRTAILRFVTGAAHPQLNQALSIRLINLDLPGTPAAPAIEVDFDNVRLAVSPVPEPAAWLLCLTAVALVGWRRARCP